MIKKIIVALGLLFSFAVQAQQGTSSPYSFYGIGDIRFKGTVENKSMGGVSVFQDSIHLNLQNPAQLSSLKLTTYALGGTYLTTKSNSETDVEKSRRTNFDYLAVAIPTGKTAFSFGLIPYSSIGYKIQTISSDASPIYNNYNGVGGVNKVFLAGSYKLTKKINVGVNFQFNFGSFQTTSIYYQTGVQYGTRENNSSYVNGYNFDLGATYQTKINKKLTYFGSLLFSPEAKLNLNNSSTIELVQPLSNGSYGSIESQDIAVDNTQIKIPSKIAIGSGFGKERKWMIGTEITAINNKVMTNRFADIQGATFENSIRYSFGGYYIPDYTSYSNYFKKITYRAGIRYENTGLVLQNKAITDFAGNIGLGLPLGGSFSNLNIGLEIGKRGTIYNNLVQENYINLSFGLSLSDRWFVKRKFD